MLYDTLEYYYTNETTDDDIVEFLASATLSESAIFGVNYTLRISVLIDKIHLWNTTVILTPKELSTNVRSKVNEKNLCILILIFFIIHRG